MDWLRAALLCAFLVAGDFARDPWKADEPYSVGMVLHFFRGDDLIVPRVAGVPFVEKPPVMYWSGAITARLTHSVLPLFAGAQLAVLGWLALAIACVGHLAARLYDREPATDVDNGSHGRTFNWLAPVLMVGSLGAIENVHKLTADVPQMTGVALALLALARLAHADADSRRWGLLLGTGTGLAFLSKGLLVPSVLGLTCIAAWVIPAYRTRRFARALRWALIASLPWVVIWPALFWHASHPLFTEWFWDNNFGRFFGFVQLGGARQSYLDGLSQLIALSFPAGWLAIGALIAMLRADGLRFFKTRPELAMLWLYVVVFLGTLASSSVYRDIYLLPIFPAIGLLGAGARCPRWLGHMWASVAIVLMSVLGLWIWVRWGLQLGGHGRVGVVPIGKWLPLDYRLAFSPGLVLFALVIAALWVAAVVRRRELGGLMVGFAGLTFVWGTLTTLVMPWLNEARSYRTPFLSLQDALAPASLNLAEACVGSFGVGESERAMLDYFIGMRPVPLIDMSDVSRCSVLLLLDKSAAPITVPAGWREIWRGGRAGDHNERFRAYVIPGSDGQ